MEETSVPGKRDFQVNIDICDQYFQNPQRR